MSNKNWKLFDFICDVHWDDMKQVGKGKHCEICSEHVQDLTDLNRERILHQLIKTRNKRKCVRISHSLNPFKSADLLAAIVIHSSGASYSERLYLLQLLSFVLISPPETESLEGVASSDMRAIFNSILHTPEEYRNKFYQSLERRQERLLNHLRRCSTNGSNQMKEMIVGRPDFSYQLIYGSSQKLSQGIHNEIRLQTNFMDLSSILNFTINHTSFNVGSSYRETINLPDIIVVKLVINDGIIVSIASLTNWSGALKGIEDHLEKLKTNVKFHPDTSLHLLLPISISGVLKSNEWGN